MMESRDTEEQPNEKDNSTPPPNDIIKQFLSEIRPQAKYIVDKLNAGENSDKLEVEDEDKLSELVLDAAFLGRQKDILSLLEELNMDVAVGLFEKLVSCDAAKTEGDTTESTDSTEEKEDVIPATVPKPRPTYNEILSNTKGTFIDTLQPSQGLLQYLQARSVFNDEMVNKVLCRPSRPDRVKCLIDLLMQLGPKSLYVFIEGLKYTKQDFLAHILYAQVK